MQLYVRFKLKLLKRSANYRKISNKYPFSYEEKLYFCATIILESIQWQLIRKEDINQKLK